MKEMFVVQIPVDKKATVRNLSKDEVQDFKKMAEDAGRSIRVMTVHAIREKLEKDDK